MQLARENIASSSVVGLVLVPRLVCKPRRQLADLAKLILSCNVLKSGLRPCNGVTCIVFLVFTWVYIMLHTMVGSGGRGSERNDRWETKN